MMPSWKDLGTLKKLDIHLQLFLLDREVGMLPPGKQTSSRETKDELCIMDTLSTKLLNKQTQQLYQSKKLHFKS